MLLPPYGATDPLPATHLYGLRPRGTGTGLVESLTSYVSRLAAAHSMSVRRLAFGELRPLLDDPRTLHESIDLRYALYGDARSINGTGSHARRWTSALEKLTGRSDLDRLSLYRWSVILPPSGLLAPQRRFCPRCFVDSTRSGTALYEPLLWSVAVVTTCPIHGALLRDRCPNGSCGAALPYLSGHTRPGTCHRCRHRLEMATPTAAAADLYGRWVSDQISAMLAAPALDAPIPPDVVGRWIRTARDHHGWTQRELASRVGVGGGAMSCWNSSQIRPTLPHLLRLVYTVGGTMLDVAEARLPAGACGTPPARQPRAGGTVDWRLVRRRLHRATDAEPPPSLATVLAGTRCRRSDARRRYPDQCEVIVRRRRAAVIVQADQRARQLEAMIVSAVASIRRRGAFPSRRRVEALLPKGSSLREARLQRAWKRAAYGNRCDHGSLRKSEAGPD